MHLILFTPIKFYFLSPSTRLPLRGTSQAAGTVFLSGSLLLSLLCLLKFLIFPLTRSGRAGPLLSGQQKVGKDWPKRAAPPLGFPLCGRARVACGHNRARGVTELLAAYAAGASAQICVGFAAKAVSDVVPCAFAHDKRTFPFGERYLKRGGKGPQKSGALAKAPLLWYHKNEENNRPQKWLPHMEWRA